MIVSKSVFSVFVLLLTVIDYCASECFEPDDPEEQEYGFEEIFKWNLLDYEDLPQQYLDLKFGPGQWPYFIPYNNLPMGVLQHGGRVFITVPRRRPGIPSTLNYVYIDETYSTPKLKPFPSYEQNLLQPNFTPSFNFVSVYRLRMDKCNRMWFVDTGAIALPEGTLQIQPPALYAIDMDTDQVVVRHEFKRKFYNKGSGMVSVTPENYGGKCSDTYVYIPDLSNYRMLVYSMKKDKMWTFEHNSFFPDPRDGNLQIGGQNFMWRDGIFSIALGPVISPTGERRAYYHAMASTDEFFVSTDVLRNETLSSRPWHGHDFTLAGNKGVRMESGATASDETNNIIFFASLQKNGISCWNLKKPLIPKNVITIGTHPDWIYPSDITIDDMNVIYFIANSMPLHLYGNLSTNDFNFRVMRQPVLNAVYGTRCELGVS